MTAESKIDNIKPLEEKPIEAEKQYETRETITMTLDRELLKELRKKSEKARLSMSRYIEITLRKALRLKS